MAADAGTSASTFTRIAQGRGTDAATFVKLVDWLGLAAERFIKRTSQKARRTETMAAISTHLRADRSLSPKAVEALEDIIGVAYKTLASEKKGRSAQRLQDRG